MENFIIVDGAANGWHVRCGGTSYIALTAEAMVQQVIDLVFENRLMMMDPKGDLGRFRPSGSGGTGDDHDSEGD
jgi:hypothetical protein